MDIEAELSNFPPGSKERILLEKVLDKLGPNFARKSVLAKAKEIRMNRNEAMQKYFERQIVKDALNKAVAEQEQQMALSTEVHPFYLEQARKSLPEDESSGISRFCGLTQMDIPKISKLETVEFQKLVSEKFKDFFKKVVEYTGGSVEEYNWENSLRETLTNIQSKIHSYEAKKKDALESRKQLKEAVDLYHKELGKSLTLLGKFLSLQQEKLDFEATISEGYKLHCGTLVKKTEVLIGKLNLATYNIQTLPALTHISSELNRKEETMKKEKQELIDTFEKYSQLGEEYESIVDEIMEFMKKIEEEEYAINHLKSFMPETSQSGLAALE